MRLSNVFFLAGTLLLTAGACPMADAANVYKVIKTAKVGGEGGFDYVRADAEGRRLYIPRSGDNGRVMVFDLDTLKQVGEIPNAIGVHGVALDVKSQHGFCSSKPVVMFDTKTLKTIKTIEVEGNPDGIHFDPPSGRVFVLSHREPHATVINSKDGSVAGTIDLGGAPEQAVSDGQGRVFIDVEDTGEVAVVDAKTLKVTNRYSLEGKGGIAAGLALDVKNHILFACCRDPQNCVILNADDGKIITSLPIGSGVDGAVFNPKTMEVFSSQRDGTLTIIKENSPTSFEIQQNVPTKLGAKTCTLDSKTNHIILISADAAPLSAEEQAAAQAQKGGPGQAGAQGRGGAQGQGQRGAPGRPRTRWLPDTFTILVVGRQ